MQNTGHRFITQDKVTSTLTDSTALRVCRRYAHLNYVTQNTQRAFLVMFVLEIQD